MRLFLVPPRKPPAQRSSPLPSSSPSHHTAPFAFLSSLHPWRKPPRSILAVAGGVRDARYVSFHGGVKSSWLFRCLVEPCTASRLLLCSAFQRAVAGARRPPAALGVDSSPDPAYVFPIPSSSSMADHFALMTGRLLTEATLRSAIHEAVAVASATAGYGHPDQSSVPEDVRLDDMGKAKSGVMVECRMCQEEGDEAFMATPCSCKGSLKYAHHVCVQKWCNEKGDTSCEICLQKFTPNFTAPLKLFRHPRNPINSRGTDERPESRSSTSYAHTADQADSASSFDSQTSNPKGVLYCRVVHIALMALLVLRDAVSLILGNARVYSTELITLLLFRTAGIVIPVYIVLITVASLYHQRLYRIQPVHTTPVSEPGAGVLQAAPPQQHQHIINIQ